MTEKKLKMILSSNERRTKLSIKQYLEKFESRCEEKQGDLFEVWSEYERYPDLLIFPDDINKEINLILKKGTPAEISEYILELKYPELQLLFAYSLVGSKKTASVLSQLIKMDVTNSREFVIYSILYAAFIRDRDTESTDVLPLLSKPTISYFIKIFFEELYRYDGQYKESIYPVVMDSMITTHNLANNYLENNLNCIVLVLDKAYPQLNPQRKNEILGHLDQCVLSNNFSFERDNELEINTFSVRKKLVYDLYSTNYEQYFNKEANDSLVRFEGWAVPKIDSRNINYECVVMMSWLSAMLEADCDIAITDHIVKVIYYRLQTQMKLSGMLDGPYKVSLEKLVSSLKPGTSLFGEIIPKFITDSEDLIFVINVLYDMVPLPQDYQLLLTQRWAREKDVTLIKVNILGIYQRDFEKKLSFLGLQK